MFRINQTQVGGCKPPYLIAELSANHNGSIDRAKESIRAAKLNGADAVKLQTYTPDTMTLNSNKPDFKIEGGLWDGRTLYELYEEAHTPWEWHESLFEEARTVGLDIFSTPFDETAVEFLETLNPPAYKIASFELTDHSLIKCVARTKKPLLMSTGMASKKEIAEALEVARTSGANDILLFHCVSEYPAPLQDYKLSMVSELKTTFDVEVGLSDHTLGFNAAMLATALGASAIEKHFTLSRAIGGPDSAFSAEPSELLELHDALETAWLALGTPDYVRSKAEEENKQFRRSLYFVSPKSAGDIVQADDLRKIRPGYGLPPSHFQSVVGKKLLQNVEPGDPVKISMIATEPG